MPTTARKRLSVPSFIEFGARISLWQTFAAWCVVKGAELRCLLYPAIAVEQTTGERNLLYFAVSILRIW